jgi:hypothetical protein
VIFSSESLAMVGFQLNPLPWPNPFHSISTALQQVNAELLVSWDDEIPNIYIWKVIKFMSQSTKQFLLSMAFTM